MAWPCNSVDPEEHYRRLERLLAELYLVLRALLAQGAPLLPPAPPNQPPQPPPAPGSSRRRRRSRPGRCPKRPDAPRPDQDPSAGGQGSCGSAPGPKEAAWVTIGLDLKTIADELRLNRQSETKCSIQQLLAPPPAEKRVERNKPPAMIT